ncbi:hypothetical protein WN55_03040 [Dufourea novaeangliae]|uniref:Uncharacterized protein n=1 Tax=Dufourea novaeangliae TaxID=178035 RepID=A0A154PHZ3_DUFNO|nr:hypothetical protein WN55_03040 [Dufourea novaeangliae]
MIGARIGTGMILIRSKSVAKLSGSFSRTVVLSNNTVNGGPMMESVGARFLRGRCRVPPIVSRVDRMIVAHLFPGRTARGVKTGSKRMRKRRSSSSGSNNNVNDDDKERRTGLPVISYEETAESVPPVDKDEPLIISAMERLCMDTAQVYVSLEKYLYERHRQGDKSVKERLVFHKDIKRRVKPMPWKKRQEDEVDKEDGEQRRREANDIFVVAES